MIKIRAKLILAFVVTVLICSILALAVSYGGYTFVVAGIAARADGNNARVASVRGIKDLLAAQQKLIAGSVISLGASSSEEFDKNSGKLTGLIDELSNQSENKEKSVLKELKGLNGQYTDEYKTKISEAVKKSDRAEYERLFADFSKQYDELISKELELRKLIQEQVDATSGLQQTEIAELGTLSADQRTTLDSLAAALANVLGSYENEALANTQLISDKKTLQAQIAELREELSSLKAGQTQSSNGNSVLQSGVQALQEQGAAAAYDSVLADTVRSYLEEALQSNTDAQTILNGLLASALTGALKKLTLIDTTLDLTRDGYSKAVSAFAVNGGNAGDFGSQLQSVSDSLKQLQLLLTAKNAPAAADASAACSTLAKAYDTVSAARDAAENAGLAASYGESDELYNRQAKLLDTLEAAYKTYLANDIEKSRYLKKDLIAALAIIAFLSLLIGMLAALWLSRNILNPIRSMTKLLEKAGKGDLTDRVENRRKDEIGELGSRVNIVLDGQQKMLEQVKSTTGDIGVLRKALADLFAHSRENAGKVRTV